MNETYMNRRLIGLLYLASALFLAVALGSFTLLRIFLLVSAIGLFFAGLSLLRGPEKKQAKRRRFYGPKKKSDNAHS